MQIAAGSRTRFGDIVGVSQPTVTRWIVGATTPGLDDLQKIAVATDYSLVAQLRDLGYLTEERIPWSYESPSISPRLLLDRLSKAVDDATLARPTNRDLAKAVMGDPGPNGRPTEGRWRATLFDVPLGVAYPHVAYRGVQFELGLDAFGHRHQAWLGGDWELQGLQPPTEYGSPWMRQLLETGTPAIDRASGEPVPELVAWERLELRWRLHDLSRQVYIQWYGELGRIHRHLLVPVEAARPGHLALVRAYQEHLPDASRSRIHPIAGERRIRRVLLVGGPASLATYFAPVIAEALGWHSHRAADLVRQYRPSPATGQSAGPAIGWDFAYLYRSIGQGVGPRECVMSISELDTLVDDTGSLTSEAEEMLSSDDSLVVLIEADGRSLTQWEKRQLDQAPKGTELRAANRSRNTEQVTSRISDLLREIDPGGRTWIHLVENRPVPWWSDEPEAPYLDPVIGDLIVQGSYSLAFRLAEGRFPTLSRRTRPNWLAPGSLLHRFSDTLASDQVVTRYWQVHAGGRVRSASRGL